MNKPYYRQPQRKQSEGFSRKKLYKAMFFDSFSAAKSAQDLIKSACLECDQLNLVIKEEGNMDNQDLLSIDPKVKVYAGDAWTLIHTRRVEEGWYQEKQFSA